MNPSNSEASDDVFEISQDLPLFMIEKVIEEVADGREGLSGAQRRDAEALRTGGRSGITRDFGKMVIDGSVEGASTAGGVELEQTDAAGDLVEQPEPEKQMMPPDVAELLVRVLSSPEFESLLDQPAPTMLWTPETAAEVSDQLAGACRSFRLGPSADFGQPGAPEAPETGEKPSAVVPDVLAAQLDTTDQKSIEETAAVETQPSSTKPKEDGESSPVLDRSQHPFLQDLGGDKSAWAKRLEIRLLLERPGKLEDLPETSSSENKKSTGTRPRIRRTMEQRAVLAEIIQRKEAQEPKDWAKPPKLRGTLERPAVLEDMIQKESAASWAKRPRLRQTLERPGNLDDILRDARTLFIGNLTAASKYYARNDDAGGDAAVDRAILELVRPGGVAEGGVSIAPIILATIDGILFEYGRVGGDASIRQAAPDESAADEIAADKRQLSMNLAQMAQMNILAANAAERSAKLVAENARALVKVEEMSNLTSAISLMVKDAISNRANSIQHASMEALAQTAVRGNSTEPLVTLIKQNVRDAIEVESRETLKHTIKTMSVKGAQDQRLAATRTQKPVAEKPPEPSKKKDDEPVSGGGGGAALERAEPTRARESVDETKESSEKLKAGPAPATEATVAAAVAETKAKIQGKKVETPEAEPVQKRHGSLEVGGPAAVGKRTEIVPQDAPGAMTVRLMGRTDQEMSRLGELLVAALSRRQLLARLLAACNTLRSENRPTSDSTIFDVNLDGLGSGETVLIVFARNQEEALRLQAQVQQLTADTEQQAKEDQQHHRCEGSETMPIQSLVMPRPAAASEVESSKSDSEKQTLGSTDRERSAGSVKSEEPKSAWDACKEALNRLFGPRSS